MTSADLQNEMAGTELVYHVARISFGGIDILMPQSEIVSIESVYELERGQSNQKYLGVIHKQGAKVPVYCFSETMNVLTYLPEDRLQCVVISSKQGNYAVLCQDINNITLNDIQIEPIPQCMNNGVVPITHLCIYKEMMGETRLGLITNSEIFNTYINS